MHCFKMPACSHLTDFLHLEFLYSNGERRAPPSSPLTTQTAPHLPILVCLYFTSTASPLSLPLFSHTSCFPGLHLFLLLSRSRGESTWLGGSEWLCGLAGGLQADQKVLLPTPGKGIRERNWTARRDIFGELAPSGNRNHLLYQK